ncbi:hypothetical protein TNCV_2975771 [Trichonephila clavipes]|nr:hypothetical protein TNCV_2975771 [Trichonephila clavipes]
MGNVCKERKGPLKTVRTPENVERVRVSIQTVPSDRMVAYRAYTPQVRFLLPGWARSTQPFIPTAGVR